MATQKEKGKNTYFQNRKNLFYFFFFFTEIEKV